MDRMTEMKFSDLQNDERYKKLERALKLAYHKKGIRLDESHSLPMSPSMSSINPDTSYQTSYIPVPQPFKVGSEIVSFSNNLRNVVLKKDRKNNFQTICTSSVRDCNSTNGLQEDYFMMPPPNFNFVPGTSKKAISTPLSSVPRTAPGFQNECALSDITKQSPKKTNSSSVQVNPNNAAQHVKYKKRIFTRWKVMLDGQGQLLIQGKINDRQLARSKPIVRRLEPAKVQSLFNHVYILDGDIVDNENELPDYVRDKFYNGFPDDWENVHQIWQMYQKLGSRLTFRWPTSLADSDDDIRSEVTNLTFASMESINESIISSFADLQTNKDKENYSMPSLNLSKVSQSNRNEEHCEQSATGASEYSYRDNKRNKLKDKLNIIINNIADKNCPQEYVSKMVEIFDCLNYLVSYGSSRETESITETSTSVQEKSMVHEQRRDTKNDKATPSKNVIEFNKSKCKNTNVHPNESIVSNNCSAKVNNYINKGNSDSESEIYSGLPKISAERILQQKNVLPNTYKRKTRATKLLKQHYNVSERTQNLLINTENINHVDYNDSSVSIIGDQTQFSEVEKLTNSKVEKNVNLGKTIRAQQKRTDVFMEERNPREIKEHFVQENVTSPHKLTENCSDFSDVNEDGACEINEISKSKNAISETNFRNKTSDKQCYNVVHNKYQVSSNTPKPVVVSPVAVDMNKLYKEIKPVRNIDRDNRGTENKLQHLTKQKSPAKAPNARKNIYSDVSIDSYQTEHEELENSIKLDHTRVCRDKQNDGDIKAKKLSGWSPKLICEPVLNLCFEGKLLNDAGHVVNRKFETDAVLHRISIKLIETVSHQFYELVGDLNKHKHAIPKQLLNQCRHGCPAKINSFCEMWKSLQSNSNAANDPVMNNIRKSSKGRKIVPPLNFWTGERMMTKQDVSVYIPGMDHDSSIGHINKSPNKCEVMKKTRNQQNDLNKENSSKKSKSPNTNLTKNTTNKNIKDTENVEAPRSKVLRKKRLAPQLSNSSNTSDSKSSPVKKRKRLTKNPEESNINDYEKESPRKLHKHSLETEKTRWDTRSAAKLVTSPVRVQKILMNQYSSSTGNHCNENYQFCKTKCRSKVDETLSEDQESYV